MKTDGENAQKESETSNSKETVIKIKDLHKSFGDNHVLTGFNMELYKGENLVIMGKSGTGKSVMIKCLVGLIVPDSGIISILGKEIKTLDQETLDNLRSNIGFLFQGSALYDSMTVRENLEFPLRRHKDKVGKNTDTESLVLETLESVGLEGSIDQMPNELSGGMQKRVALARTLILKPKIVLYDEPTTGLDPITSKEIVELMRTIQEKYGTSSVIITHDVDCARAISDRIILNLEGINYTEGTYEELQKSKDPKVASFFK